MIRTLLSTIIALEVGLASICAAQGGGGGIDETAPFIHSQIYNELTQDEVLRLTIGSTTGLGEGAAGRCLASVRSSGCTSAGDPGGGGTGPAQCAKCCDSGAIFDVTGDGVVDTQSQEQNCNTCCERNFTAGSTARMACTNSCTAVGDSSAEWSDKGPDSSLFSDRQ